MELKHKKNRQIKNIFFKLQMFNTTLEVYINFWFNVPIKNGNETQIKKYL